MGKKRKTCLTCRKFSKCDDPYKSGLHVCSKWKKFKIESKDHSGLDLSQVFGHYASREANEQHIADDFYADEVAVDHAHDYRSMEVNLVKMMDKIFDDEDDNPYPKDLKIDDSDLPEFDNVYDYFYHDYYGMAKNMKPFSRQMWIAMQLFSDYCPVCSDRDFVSDIDNVPVDMRAINFPDRVQFLKKGKCPKCKRTRDEMVKKGYMNWYRGLAACIGQRAGKSVTFSFLEGYITHKYLKMQKPSELLTGLPNVTLTATFTATDFKTAMETLWQPFTDVLVESVWYKEYHEMLNYYGKKYGEEIFKFKDSFIHYKHRKMFLSAASPNKRTLRGRTRYSYAIDELGWFDADKNSGDKVRISADEIYGALDRSMKTATSSAKALFLKGYRNITPPMAFNISSPASYEDKIMSMTRTFKDSRIILSVHLPTWEFNPKEPKTNFKKEYMEDPIKAERDFGANPPLADSPFIENSNAVTRSFDKYINAFEYQYIDKKRKGKKSLKRSAKVKIHPHGDLYPAVLSLDAGVTNNSFALSVGYRKDNVVRFHGLIELIPEKGKIFIDHNAAYETIIKPIIKDLNVQHVFADRWNSLFLLHKIEEDFGINAEQYSMKYKDFLLFKSFHEGGRVLFPRLEMKPREILDVYGEDYMRHFYYRPTSHLFQQLLTVQDNGKTVLKGTNKTDDLFRAVALGCTFLLDEDWCKENLKGDKKRNMNRGLAALANGGSHSSSALTTSSGKGIGASGSGSG